MKKKDNRKWQILFWVFVIGGTLWLVFAPRHDQTHHAPHQVQVTQIAPTPAPEEKPPVATGEEKVLAPSEALPPPVSETPKSVANGKAVIAIVIDDVGLDVAGSRRAVALPGFITLSYIPYSQHLQDQAKEARNAGHELLLHMPMQPVGHEDPGPGALIVGLPMDELRHRFDAALASFTGFDGMNNHMGSKFTADTEGMEMVIDELQQRHLFYLDSRTSLQSVGAKVAKERGLPTVSRDVFLDDVISVSAIQAQLEQAEHVAKRKGYAIAIGHPHTATLQALEEWIPDVQRRGFTLVPVNSLVNQELP